MKRLLTALVLGAALVLAGCATPNTSGRVYSDAGSLSQQTADLARVVSVRQVMIQPRAGHTGTYVGTAIGGAAGYTMTRNARGSFRGLGTILGGAAGAAAGSAISGHHGAHPGVQIFVQRLDNAGRAYGSMIAVVQDADQVFQPGQMVLLVRGRDGLSVAPVSG